MVLVDQHESMLGGALLAAGKAEKLGDELRKKIEPLRVTELSPSRSFPLRERFEAGGAFWNDPAPYGWWPCGRVAGVEFIRDTETGCDGKSSLCLRKTTKRYFPIAPWCRTMKHTGGTGELRVSAQVKAEQATKAVIDVLCSDADGEWLGHKWAVYIGAKQGGDPPANHDGKEYSGSVATWPGTKRIVIGLQIYGPGPSGSTNSPRSGPRALARKREQSV